MRRFLSLFVLLVLAMPLVSQSNKPSLDQLMASKKQAEKAAIIMREITQVDYRAAMDIPAGDGLFIYDGQVLASTYHAAAKSGIAVKAGQSVKVTQIRLLDFGVQIYVGDNCAMIGYTDKFVTTEKTDAEITLLVKKTLAAMFEAVPRS